MNRTVIIDTDPGLDDAVAILYALNSGHFDVLGLTTVAGNIGLDTTTRNAGRLLALMQRGDVPVVRGASAPLKRRGIDEVAIHGDDGLGGVALPNPTASAHSEAAAWMDAQLRAHPVGSVDILALGPLTNLAMLLRDYPDAARRIGRLIVMGGAVFEKGNVGPHSEFNFASDPEALDIVLRAGTRMTIIPLDVTRKVRADHAFVESLRMGGVAGQTSAHLIAAYFQGGRESRPLHDPCVMLYVVRPELFSIETHKISVDLGDDADAGALLRFKQDAVEVEIAMGVDAAGALKLLAEGLV